MCWGSGGSPQGTTEICTSRQDAAKAWTPTMSVLARSSQRQLRNEAGLGDAMAAKSSWHGRAACLARFCPHSPSAAGAPVASMHSACMRACVCVRWRDG